MQQTNTTNTTNAYARGWREGRFTDERASDSEELRAIQGDAERLAFWQGHRRGRATREQHRCCSRMRDHRCCEEAGA